jgi:hypothetical protein
MKRIIEWSEENTSQAMIVFLGVMVISLIVTWSLSGWIIDNLL